MKRMAMAWGWKTIGWGGALAGLAAWSASCADPLNIVPPTSAPAGEGGQSTTTGDGGGSTGTGGGAPTTCVSNSDCAAPTAVCDTAKSICVQCLEIADCAFQPGTVCSAGSCVCPTDGESWCEPDLCVDLETSPDHCGQCYHPCFGACSGGACVDEWEPTATEGAPSARFSHTAVWTDSHMIVWGGGTASGIANNTNTGAMYDPATFEWTATSVVNAPTPRRDHTAVWTGSEMIVWGGRHGSANGALGTGAIFDPATNTWQATSTDLGPEARYQHTAVWTGTHMIVWGGVNGAGAPIKSGASYDPSTDTWTTLNQPGPTLVERTGHSALWNGSLMLVYGGRYDNVGWIYLPDTTNNLPGGLQYNPSTGIWSNLQPSGQPTARAFHTAVMLGSDMVVWGGYDGANPTDTGARYDTTGLTWSTTNPPQPEARYDHTAVVLATTPEVMVIWGGVGASGAELDTGGIYELANNSWTATATALSARTSHTAISTGDSMIVWGGSQGGTPLGDGGVFTPQ